MTSATITFGGAVGVNAPAIFDSTNSQASGACTSGINKQTATDGASIAGAVYIGGVAAPLKVDTNKDALTP